jgi:broad specificity phosphatase PhoE
VGFSFVVVDTDEALAHYGLDRKMLESQYYDDHQKTVLLLRHGQSTANVSGDCADPELTELGQEQAAEVADFADIDTVIVSPHVRTLQTFKSLSIGDCSNVLVDAALAEFNRDERQNALPTVTSVNENLLKLGIKPTAVVMESPSTENKELMEAALAAIANAPGSRILVVCHRVVIRSLTNLDIRNCAVVECSMDHGSIEAVRLL